METNGKFRSYSVFTVSYPNLTGKPATARRKSEYGGRENMDRNWGIAVAAAVASFFNLATQINSGFFFVAIMDTFAVGHSNASWPESVFTIMTYSGSLIVVVLQRHFTVSQITLLGSLMLWIPLIGAAFAPNITMMTLALGALHGMGAGIVLVSFMVTLGLHFDKYLAVASGLRDAGTTLCAFVFPSLLSFLNSRYCLRGTLLVYSALAMNVTVVALFLWVRVRESERQDCPEGPRPVLKTTKKEGVFMLSKSQMTLNTFPKAVRGDNECEESFASFLRKLAILRAPSFYVVVLGATVEIYGYTVFLETIDSYALDKGASRPQADMAITYATIAEIVGYVGVPLIADMNFVSRQTMMTTCFALLTLCYALVPYTSWPMTYVVDSALLITFIAAVSSLRCSLMTQYFGAVQVPLCMTAVGLLLIPLQLSSPTIIGFFRDNLGSYDGIYRALAVLHLAMVMLYAPLAVHERRKKRGSFQAEPEACAQVTKL
ncbi:monocarboxylate transporter 9-like [Dermacentor silvarum]|uniref:monocarboxylate transporter 9-like n=1 Tax=Dermacentor silvarum TaxID=543639 RepID=UPI001898CDA4|nr:monocarboxylate transporter 9-like [Dermacentor silvarum]